MSTLYVRQVSLTQIVATGCAIEPKTRPTAPSLATLERGLDSVDAPDPCANQRPPPFAPGHGCVLMSPGGDVTSPHEGPSISPTPAADLTPETDAQRECDATGKCGMVTWVETHSDYVVLGICIVGSSPILLSTS